MIVVCSKCGAEFEQHPYQPGSRRCTPCKNAHTRQYRKLNPEMLLIREKKYAKYRNEWTAKSRKENPEEYKKQLARNALYSATKRGKIQRQPCEVCGTTKTDAHHDDYSKPLDVRWLCRPHHIEHHAKEKSHV